MKTRLKLAVYALALVWGRASSAVPLSVSVVTSDNGLPAHSVQWTDGAGLTRTAIMVDQRTQGAGYLRQLTYPVGGVARTCRGTGANGHQGDGFVQHHTANGGDSSSRTTAGTTTMTLTGVHHAIVTYNMPAYKLTPCWLPTPPLEGTSGLAPAATNPSA